jgi:hypothetical protein
MTCGLPIPGDPSGFDLKPNPLSAQSAADLILALREYRIWAGDMSLRAIARGCSNQISASAICLALGHAALDRNELPKLPVVLAVVSACSSHDQAELKAWAATWRNIRMRKQVTEGGPTLRAVKFG